MNKIVSNFYLIRLDGEPVYVGYTNRTIKQRFSEHKHDKDFGDIDPTIESLGKLQYDFTWDLGLINQYAKEVSDKETNLVEEYGTHDSIWQKGVNGNIGGQTWANVKSFVKTNRDNPTFREMNESDIMMLLEWQRRSYQKLKDMINHTNIKGYKKLNNMVNHTNIKGAIKIQHMVSHTNVRGSVKLKSMVYSTNVKGSRKLKSIVDNTNIKGAIKLQNMVNHTNIKGARNLESMINNTKARS